MGDKIRTIAHLSDIHIRKLHRLVEYRQVFQRLYGKLKQLKPDLIFVGGDIVHGKLDTSPEETRLVSSLFLELTNIADTIVIIGNHDTNLQNKSREDVLSPIVDLVKEINPNIYYWKKSGKYTIKNVDFGVLSILDIDKDGNQFVDNLPNSSIINNEYNIALYHGQVDKFYIDNGLQMFNPRVTIDTFSDYDIVMLGDIHKRQFLNDDKTIGYCGSLIQQNFSEEPSHGFLLWDLETKSAQYHGVENNFGFKTVEVIDGIVQNKMTFVPPKGNIRIKYWNTTLEQIKDIQIDLRTKYPKLKEIKAEKQDTLSILDKGNRVNKIDIGDVRDINYQNKLIEDFLNRNIENIDNTTIQRICNINELTNNSPEIYDGGIARNVSWKLKSFEFDNMFSFGKNNKIDFEQMHGTVGLVAPNHSGKSAMLDAVAYTIFDTCSRTFKAVDVLNKRKQKFRAKLNLEINGEDYWIEREGILKSRKNRKTGEMTYTCPVKVNFYMIDGDEKIDLAGAARRNTQYGGGTNEEIRRLLGTFDDFILTSLSLQTNGINFIDKKQADRKQILFQFMDIDIFDQLYNIAKEDSNEERALLKSFQKKDSYIELVTVENKLKDYQKKDIEISKKIEKYNEKIERSELNKVTYIKKLWKFEDWDIDIDELKISLEEYTKQRKQLQNQLQNDIEYKENLRPLYLEHYDKVNQLDEDIIKTNYKIFQQTTQQLDMVIQKLKGVRIQISTNQNTLKELKRYKYDRNCSYCVQNATEHISHKQQIEDNVSEVVKKQLALTQEKDAFELQLTRLVDAEQNKEEYDVLIEELNQISRDAIKIGGKIDTTEEKVKLLKEQIDNTTETINKYYESEQKIISNQKINEKIEEIIVKINRVVKERDALVRDHKIISSQLAVTKTRKETIEEDIQRLIETEQKILDYDLYLMAMSKDGVSYELVSKTLPAIEAEINEVLDNMMTGFTIKLEMEEKNINTYICYGDNNKWPLDLASGMERFVSSLAIRVGLINVSTLPRPNFLCLDEGFGTLDGENIINMEGAFNYLKTQFDFTLIITHLDSIKDYTDHLISIDIKGEDSQIIFA